MEALLDYDKSELINGVVYNMAPPNLNHRRIQRRLTRVIDNFLRGKRCEVFFEAEVEFDEDNKLIPDVSIVCDSSKETLI